MATSPEDNSAKNPDTGLTPEQERIVKRIRSLAMISAGVMGLAVLLVLSAIVYRIVKPGGDGEVVAESAISAASVSLPQGAKVVQSTIDGRRLVLTVEHDGGTQIVIFDVIDWQVIGTVDLK